ncbi:MAG TPA: hypothetical protein PKD51_11505 [Saprospiraceae bacterium]|nr:hypothetical protein [Saprospiraceae bacterium]
MKPQTQGTFSKGKKFSNKKTGFLHKAKGKSREIESKKRFLESELAKKINDYCDMVEAHIKTQEINL